MEIGVFGCSHTFGTGEASSFKLYELSQDIDKTKIELANTGYPAHLAKEYPQHNFEVVPTLDGGNREIINSLVNCIQENPKDMYIVNTTQWHRASLGLLFFNKKLYDVTNNLSYRVYDPGSYHAIRYSDIHHCHFPNYLISQLPGQPPHVERKGTFRSAWLMNEEFCPESMMSAIEFFAKYDTVMVGDHIPSQQHLLDLYTSYNLLHYLAEKENIWYFWWYMPFGRVIDNKDWFPPEIPRLNDIQAKYYNQLIRKDHPRLISRQTIYNYFNLDENSIELDDELHLPDQYHAEIVNLLLSNPKFKETLDG